LWQPRLQRQKIGTLSAFYVSETAHGMPAAGRPHRARAKRWKKAMHLLNVNSPLSLQESELIQLLRQQEAFWVEPQGSESNDTWTGQNLPQGTNALHDPDLSPHNIDALLLNLQEQHALLDKPPVGDTGPSPGRKILADYLA
jgi:hypothetical protein